MKTIPELLYDLDGMVDNGTTPKHEIRGQISLIGREVAVVETAYASLAESHAQLKDEHEKLQTAHSNLRSKPLPPPAGERLQTVLLAVHSHSEQDAAFPQLTGFSEDVVVDCLHELRTKGFAEMNMEGWSGNGHYLTPKGRRWLIENGLIA